ncbi:MAG: cyclic nucleotide-binding domain-containing protein [Chloroflexi bacterium]|nr:cyclic nucleotide-binding domain-containing protein [Chloroflexota bacterium]
MTTVRTPAKIIPRAFPGIMPDEMQEIIMNSRIKAYPPDTVICRENEVEFTFYMILEGEFKVTKVINNSQDRLLKTLTAGDFFGEMALIHNAPRAATVTALTNATLLELDKEGFKRVLKHSPSVSLAMVSEISNRLRQNDELTIEDLRMRAAELADAYQRLAQQDLARHEFLSNVAHELRTPLMVASGYLHAFKKGMVTSGQLDSTMDTITRNVDQIVTLTNDILFLQEIELVLPEFQSVNLVQIAEDVAKAYQDKAQSKLVKLTIKGGNHISAVQGDKHSIQRAVTALVDNAIKFSNPNGSVEIYFSENGTRASISVEDHGIGIAPEIRPRIFDRFVHLEKSGDELYGGLGIGLSITRQVIQQHNGTLEVESKPGMGSKFTISLMKWQ